MNIDPKKLQNFEKLPADVRREFSLLMNQWENKKSTQKVQSDFMSFVKSVWPGFVEGEHHIRIGEKFEKVLSGEIKRLIVNIQSMIGLYLSGALIIGCSLFFNRDKKINYLFVVAFLHDCSGSLSRVNWPMKLRCRAGMAIA